jgi:hemoglobin
MTTYKQVGGLKTFRRLARAFYGRVTCDPVLKPSFPNETAKQIERLALFLAETFGGPNRYSQLHCGQQNLRQMHGAFVIGEQEIKAWKKHMNLDSPDKRGVTPRHVAKRRGMRIEGAGSIV